MGRSAMVGNDFVISSSLSLNKNEKAEKPALEPLQQIVMPRESSEYSEPYQNFGTLAYNSPAAGHPSFALPSVTEVSSNLLSRVKIVPLVTAVVVAGLMVGTLVYKQQIISQVSKAEVAVSEAEQAMTGHRASPPAPNPRQLIIHNSDYDSALTALMTQPISLTVGSSSLSVSSTTIVSWINVNKGRSLTTLSVNTGQVASYLSQLTKSGAYPKAAFNQITDNLLKAKGMTVTLPTL